MPTYVVTFKDGKKVKVRLKDDDGHQRDSNERIAKDVAIRRYLKPGTMPEKISAGGKVESVKKE